MALTPAQISQNKANLATLAKMEKAQPAPTQANTPFVGLTPAKALSPSERAAKQAANANKPVDMNAMGLTTVSQQIASQVAKN